MNENKVEKPIELPFKLKSPLARQARSPVLPVVEDGDVVEILLIEVIEVIITTMGHMVIFITQTNYVKLAFLVKAMPFVETRTKLDNQAEKTVLVGYKQGGCKLFNPVTKKVIVSRDVIFDEKEAWKWNEKIHEENAIYVLEEEESVVLNEVPPSESCAGTSLPQISTESGGQEDIANYRYACKIMSDWGGDLDDRKSTSGYCFMLGTTTCSWSSKKQSIVALSTCEAEYVATASSACQTIWLKNVMNQIHFPVGPRTSDSDSLLPNGPQPPPQETITHEISNSKHRTNKMRDSSKDVPRRCVHYASEKTPQWRKG
nr:uncharacterized mitochondrial protein AtMg00810-like [Ipomoea batatas]